MHSALVVLAARSDVGYDRSGHDRDLYYTNLDWLCFCNPAHVRFFRVPLEQ